jgi:hypothetical protein
MLKYFLLGISAAILVTPAGAQTVEFSCVPGPSLHQAFINMGYPENNQQVMHLIVNRNAGTVIVWETSPGSANDDKTSYPATFSGPKAAWTIGDIQDGPQAHDFFDSSTNVLTTVPPDSAADPTDDWNCSVN